MSKIFTKRVGDTLLKTNDTLVDNLGMPCKLYNYIGVDDSDDLYGGNSEYAESVDTSVIIEHNPDKKRLKALGLWQEDATPIIAHFKEVDKVVRKSRIEFEFEYAYNNTKAATKFEVVDIKIYGNQFTAKQIFLLAPVRGENVCPT